MPQSTTNPPQFTTTSHGRTHRVHDAHGQLVPIPIAVLDLNKLSKVFYHAAWVMALGPALQRTDKSALPKIWQTHVAEIFAWGRYDPIVRDIDVDTAAVNRDADARAGPMIEHYLDLMYERSPRAAHTYALSIYARQKAAENYIAAVWEGQRQMNADVAGTAGAIANGLNNTIAVCELLLAVGALVIGAGVAVPAFLAGGAGMALTSVAGMAVPGMVLGTTYSFASKAVTATSIDDLKGVALDFGKDLLANAGTTVGGLASDHLREASKDRLAAHTKTYDRAVNRSAKINQMLREDFIRSPATKTLGEKLSANVALQRSSQEAMDLAKSNVKTGNVGVRAFPLIQFVYDVNSLRNSWLDRKAQLGPN